MTFTLSVRHASTGENFEYGFDREIVIGRAAACDVVLPHEEVSPEHARIAQAEHGWAVCDAGSTNGTRVGGKPLAAGERRLLADGDVIEIAAFTLRFAAAAARPTTREGTASLARRMVRDVLGVLNPGEQTPTLTVRKSGRVIAIPPTARPLVVGRDPASDVRLDDPDVSREHARLSHDWTGVHLEDLGAKNPTLIGREPISGRRRLHDGDRLLIGSTELVFTDPAERYLRQLDGRPDRPSMVWTLSRRRATGILAIYAAGALLLAFAAAGLWLIFR